MRWCEGEKWCVLGDRAQSGGAAATRPTFQPVRAKILPAEPIFTARSRKPSIARPAHGRGRRTHVLPDLVGNHDRRGRRDDAERSSSRSSRGHTATGGIDRVVDDDDPRLRPDRRPNEASSNRQCGGVRRTMRGTPPAWRSRAGRRRRRVRRRRPRRPGGRGENRGGERFVAPEVTSTSLSGSRATRGAGHNGRRWRRADRACPSSRDMVVAVDHSPRRPSAARPRGRDRPKALTRLIA